MGESAEGKGLGRILEGLGEDRRVAGDAGGWGDFGGFWRGGGRQIRLGNRLIQGLSKAYPGLKDNQGLSLSPG